MESAKRFTNSFRTAEMKGYYTDDCFMGYIPATGSYEKFASESDYADAFAEMEVYDDYH